MQERYAKGRRWDMGGVLIVLPGRQAARRLHRLLEQGAEAQGLHLISPEITTPADLPERLFTSSERIASPMEAFFAWGAAIQRLSAPDLRRLAPKADADSSLAWMGLASHATEVRTQLMAEGLSLVETARRCATIPGFCDDARWTALAVLEQRYQETLRQADMTDRDDARLVALHAGTLACERDIVLIGAVDLNEMERAMLGALRTPIVSILPAPQEMQDGFDAVCGLRSEFWQDHPLPIPDDRLHFVESPAAEAQTVAALVAALDGQYCQDEITLGAGDESAPESLTRRLASLGLPTVSPYGIPLARVRPARLLGAILDYLHDSNARRFAALVRHPDLEDRLAASCPGGFLDALDLYLAEHLPERLPDTGLPPPLDEAHEAVQRLLASFPMVQALSDWAEPIADVLRAIYGGHALDDTKAEDRQMRRGLAGIAGVLQATKHLALPLAPRLSGRDALAFVLGRLEGARLPDDEAESGIRMMGWLELALDDAPVLLLTGLHEGAIPAGIPPDPLLPDTLRRALGLPDSRRRQARDAFLLRVILESRPHVHLISTRRGEDGESQRPSRLLFLCDGETAARRAARYAAGISSTPGSARGADTLFIHGAGRTLPPPHPEPLPTPLTRLRVTAFRDYLACPYRFYLRHVLRLNERDDSADEMDPRLFGILLHECLAAFARAPVAESPDSHAVQRFLQTELQRQAQKQFGAPLSPHLRLQVRQAGRRLDAFARWQVDQTAQGWLIQHDLSERDLEAEIMVDDQPFTLTGRLDRVDYHPSKDHYRIVDYKTGDSGQGPDEKHRGRTTKDSPRPWTDLQLPLYRLLAEANGIASDRLEVGYVLLAADLRPVSVTDRGRRDGGLGYVPAAWTEEERAGAYACAEDVIRAVRAERFWPPAAPPRFADAYGPLCLDSCRDRSEWLGSEDAPPGLGAGGL